MSSQEPTREERQREYYRTRLQSDHPIHLIASITLLTAEEGGRINGVKTGYRGQFHYDDHDWDAIYTFATDDGVKPGETSEAMVQLMSPWEHSGRLFAGKQFLVRDGPNVVARGLITWVDDEL
jgi:translation elongation factor EF-Tu-like GTPase